MSPVIKLYIYIPIPVVITDKPSSFKNSKGVNFKWVSASKDPSRLSVSLYRWLRQRAFAPTANLN
jgi:hypothetical protein